MSDSYTDIEHWIWAWTMDSPFECNLCMYAIESFEWYVCINTMHALMQM